MPVDTLDAPRAADPGKRLGKSYARLTVQDRTGVLAEIAIAMRDAGVSVESFIQRGAQDGAALIAMVTHAGESRAVDAAVRTLSDSPNLLGAPMIMPILDL
jgi:homoserine dehydrogenase